MNYSKDELILLNNALNEILHGPEAIEDWEFQTRIGSTKEEAESLLKKLKEQLVGTDSSSSDFLLTKL